MYLSGSTPISNNITVPNYRSVKAVLCGLLLYKFHISACIFCSNLRTETIKFRKLFSSCLKFLFPRSVNQTNMCTHTAVCVLCVYNCIVQLY
jgi:hypothetical protein